MKRFILLVLCALCIFNASAQNVSVYNIIWGPLGVDVEYNDNMEPVSHTFTLIFQDSRYQVLENRFVYAMGSAQDIFDSLRPIEDFATKYDMDGVRKEYGEATLTRVKIPLLNYVNVDLEDNEFNIEIYTINQIKKRLVKYCKKYKLELPK